MNTEKLHIIAKALQTELKRCNTVAALQEAVNALQQLVRQPNQPNHQQQLSNTLQELYGKLEDSPVDDFSPAWRDVLNELGVTKELGIELKNEIKSIIESNEMTPQIALEKITHIQSDINQTQTNLNGIVQGLSYFNVGEDTLEEDNCEVGVVIPRKYVHNNLKDFGKELIELEKTLIVFSELATGERSNLSIRTISSSELSVFLDFLPITGASIAVAVERVTALYKNMLEIKILRAKLAEQNVPTEKLTGIEEYAESSVAPRIDEIADELIEEYGGHLDESRKNELRIELRHSLKKIANRVDRGFNFELRVAPIEQTEEADDNENTRIIQRIIEAAKNIEYTESYGDPVLFFPENDIDEDESDNK